MGSKESEGRAWPAGSCEAGHPLIHSLAQVTPDGSRSAGHAGPFTERRIRQRVRCQPIDTHISSEQVLTAWSCAQTLGLSILAWQLSSRKCVSTLEYCVKLRFCVMLEDVWRGMSGPARCPFRVLRGSCL